MTPQLCIVGWAAASTSAYAPEPAIAPAPVLRHAPVPAPASAHPPDQFEPRVPIRQGQPQSAGALAGLAAGRRVSAHPNLCAGTSPLTTKGAFPCRSACPVC
jgi:hypothetical protein